MTTGPRLPLDDDRELALRRCSEEPRTAAELAYLLDMTGKHTQELAQGLMRCGCMTAERRQVGTAKRSGRTMHRYFYATSAFGAEVLARHDAMSAGSRAEVR